MAEQTGPVELYRFRVRTADGREMTSGVLRVVLPPPLSMAKWPAAALSPGKVSLEVRAPGREGQRVEFTVERQAQEAWEPIAAGEGAVQNGRAAADVELPALPGPARPVRFFARTDDGAEACSVEATLQSAVLPEGELSEPEWSAAEVPHGGEAALSVRAPAGLEGRSVRFVIEASGEGGWKELQAIVAQVREGLASASVRLEHPAAAKASVADLLAAKALPVRFRAELV